MYSKSLVKLVLISAVYISFWSCSEAPKVIESIDFSSNYKFNSQIQEKVDKETNPVKYQLAAADYATKGDYTNALLQWDLAMRGRERNYNASQIDSLRDKYTVANAKEFIVVEAAKHQVVIINEAHHNSRHRLFTKSLLEDLYHQGYRYLLLEALTTGNTEDTELNSQKYPIQGTGYYIRDPQFGNMVRTALELGFTLIPYETTGGENNKEREIAQAKNLQKIIEKDPKGKYIIHCGFDHVLEGNHRSWEKAMAGRLQEYIGIDPLTIHQVMYSERGNPKYNHPLLKAFDLKTSSVLLDKNNQPIPYTRGEARTDIAVFHPTTSYIDNRPNWLFTNGNQKVTIDLQPIELEFPLMVLAYKKGEPIKKAVPVDITEVDGKSASCTLALPAGAYEIVLTNGKQSVKFEKVVE